MAWTYFFVLFNLLSIAHIICADYVGYTHASLYHQNDTIRIIVTVPTRYSYLAIGIKDEGTFASQKNYGLWLEGDFVSKFNELADGTENVTTNFLSNVTNPTPSNLVSIARNFGEFLYGVEY